MGNKDRAQKMVKKPKKDQKIKAVTKEEAIPVNVEVVKRKRKEQVAGEE